MDLPISSQPVSEIAADEKFLTTEPTLLTTDNFPAFVARLQTTECGENGARYVRIGDEVYVADLYPKVRKTNHVEMLREILPLSIDEGLAARSVAILVADCVASLGFPPVYDSFDAGFITLESDSIFILKPSNFLKDVLSSEAANITSTLVTLLKHPF